MWLWIRNTDVDTEYGMGLKSHDTEYGYGIQNTEWVSNHMIRNAVRNTEYGMGLKSHDTECDTEYRIRASVPCIHIHWPLLHKNTIRNTQCRSDLKMRNSSIHTSSPVAEYGAGEPGGASELSVK
jgi:hypothetical protein